MKRRLFAVAFISALLTGVAITAWQVRDQTTQTTAVSGSGVVTGVVLVDMDNPQPARRATVRLSGAGTTVRTVGTDDQGRFRFDGLPAGRVTLSASKAGFVQTFHGSTRPGRGPGVPVAVGDGQTVNIVMKMLPGAVITGVITDGRGGPVPGVTVAAAEVGPAAGSPSAPVRVVTDDRGIYRIFGLAPAEYLVTAIPQLVPASDGRGVQSGAAVMATTDADVQRARSAAGPGPRAGAEQSTRPVAYAPVFYPGTTDAAGAATIRVGAGEERSGVDMPLAIVAFARLAGTLADGTGQPITSAMVSLIPKRGEQPSPVDALMASGAIVLPRATVAASTFSFTGVAPGQYTMVARTGSGQRGAVAAEAALPTLWSVTDVTVDGTDRADLELRLMPGLTVTGRYVFERGASPPVDPATLNLSLVAINPLPGVSSTFRAAVQPDGTFRVPSLAPGRYVARIEPSGAPAPGSGVRWTLKSAMVSGRDVADRPFEAPADGRELSGVVVTFTDRAAEVTGRLVDASGGPVTLYSIIVFTRDRSLWLPRARRIQVTRPATDGSFVIGGLPAGDYGIAAVENIEDADSYAPAFLSPLLTSAFTITLGEGETKRQDFRVGG